MGLQEDSQRSPGPGHVARARGTSTVHFRPEPFPLSWEKDKHKGKTILSVPFILLLSVNSPPSPASGHRPCLFYQPRGGGSERLRRWPAVTRGERDLDARALQGPPEAGGSQKGAPRPGRISGLGGRPGPTTCLASHEKKPWG